MGGCAPACVCMWGGLRWVLCVGGWRDGGRVGSIQEVECSCSCSCGRFVPGGGCLPDRVAETWPGSILCLAAFARWRAGTLVGCPTKGFSERDRAKRLLLACSVIATQLAVQHCLVLMVMAPHPARSIGGSSRLPRLLALHPLSSPSKTRVPSAGYALAWERGECSTLGGKCGVWGGAGQTGVPGGWLRLCHRLAIDEAGALWKGAQGATEGCASDWQAPRRS